MEKENQNNQHYTKLFVTSAYLETKRCRNACLILELRPNAFIWLSQIFPAAWERCQYAVPERTVTKTFCTWPISKYSSQNWTATDQMNSRQMEQNVGCLKNVAMNLCPLTWWTRRFRAPRRLCIGPSFSLNIRSFGNSSQYYNHSITVNQVTYKKYKNNTFKIHKSQIW